MKRSINPTRTSRTDVNIGKLLYPEHVDRPPPRSECRGGHRPCPLVSCRWHLYLDVNEATGSILYNFPGIEPWEMEVSCALDVAESGEMTLEEVGALMNLTRERIRQIEKSALRKLFRLDQILRLRNDARDSEDGSSGHEIAEIQEVDRFSDSVGDML